MHIHRELSLKHRMSNCSFFKPVWFMDAVYDVYNTHTHTCSCAVMNGIAIPRRVNEWGHNKQQQQTQREHHLYQTGASPANQPAFLCWCFVAFFLSLSGGRESGGFPWIYWTFSFNDSRLAIDLTKIRNFRSHFQRHILQKWSASKLLNITWNKM